MTPSSAAPKRRAPVDRAAVNRTNAQRSTGPVTESGKQRAAINALRHGLAAQTAVLPSEDLAAFQLHVQQFVDEYRPVTPTDPPWFTSLPTPPGARTASRSLKPTPSPASSISPLEQLRSIQAERRAREQEDFKDAAAVFELHKKKGIPFEPAEHGFVFSKDQIERFAQRRSRLRESRPVHLPSIS